MTEIPPLRGNVDARSAHRSDRTGSAGPIRRVPVRSLLLSLLVSPLVGLLACGRQEPVRLPVYADLVLDGSVERSGPALGEPSRVACADETRFALALPAGSSLRLPLTLGTEPHLLVSACSAEGPATLTLTVEGTGGLATETRLDLPGAADSQTESGPVAGWNERTLDLTAQSGGRATLHVQVGGTGVVYVSDLAVRHLLPPDELDERGEVGQRGGTAGPDRSRPKPGRRILLISVDTLREDALGADRQSDPADRTAGGSPAPSPTPSPTPSLDAFAREAETWSPHYAAASWTKPSHASLLTGLPPAVHGADSIEGAMIPGATTLAQRFAAAGAHTVGLVRDCEWLDPELGFDRGFESYRVVPWQASQQIRVAETWLVSHRDRDLFFFLHLFTPHSDTWKLPYEAAGFTRAEVARRWGVEDYGCRAGHCASELLKALNAGLEPLPDEGDLLHALYRRGVSDVDRALGTLFDDLRQAGLWDDLTVVVTSDHGEAFFEHGQVLHTTVHQEIVRVPLMIKWPDGTRAGTRRDTPTSALDVAPTLLAAAGLPTDGLPEPPLAKRSAHRPIFAGTTRRAVIAGPWKVILDMVHYHPDLPLTAWAELYRLDEDPEERHDLAAAHPEEVERLKAVLDQEIRREQTLRDALVRTAGGAGTKASPELTDEERRRLRSLGYLN